MTWGQNHGVVSSQMHPVATTMIMVSAMETKCAFSCFKPGSELEGLFAI